MFGNRKMRNERGSGSFWKCGVPSLEYHIHFAAESMPRPASSCWQAIGKSPSSAELSSADRQLADGIRGDRAGRVDPAATRLRLVARAGATACELRVDDVHRRASRIGGSCIIHQTRGAHFPGGIAGVDDLVGAAPLELTERPLRVAVVVPGDHVQVAVEGRGFAGHHVRFGADADRTRKDLVARRIGRFALQVRHRIFGAPSEDVGVVGREHHVHRCGRRVRTARRAALAGPDAATAAAPATGADTTRRRRAARAAPVIGEGCSVVGAARDERSDGSRRGAERQSMMCRAHGCAPCRGGTRGYPPGASRSPLESLPC